MNKKNSSRRSNAQEILIEKIISADFVRKEKKEKLIKDINLMDTEQFKVFLKLIKGVVKSDNKEDTFNSLVGEQQKSYQEILLAIDKLLEKLTKNK